MSRPMLIHAQLSMVRLVPENQLTPINTLPLFFTQKLLHSAIFIKYTFCLNLVNPFATNLAF